jgi:intracellular multiplication protein IcmG
MANDDNRIEDEEYHLVEPDQDTDANVFGAETGGSKIDFKAIWEHPARKRVLLVVGIVLTIFIVYKLLGLVFAPGPKSTSISNIPQAPSRQAARMPASPPPVQRTQPAASSSSAARESVVELEAVKRRLQTMEQNGLRTREEIGQIANALSAVTKTLEQVDDKMSQLRVSLANLSDQFEQQKYQLSELKQQQQQVASKTSDVVHKPSKPVYYIQAIIPGRAWLKNTNGTTLTVSEGQTVPGNGEVRIIDPIQGRVVLSSGQIIEYSPTES